MELENATTTNFPQGKDDKEKLVFSGVVTTSIYAGNYRERERRGGAGEAYNYPLLLVCCLDGQEAKEE